MNLRLLSLAVFVAAVLVTGCNSKPDEKSDVRTDSGPVTNYVVRGVLKSVAADKKSVVIHHEAVPGMDMPEMTMPFTVRPPDAMPDIPPGSSIEFRLNVTAKDGWIDQIRPVTNAPPSSAESSTNSPQDFYLAPAVPVLNVGEVVPSYRFTNQLGMPIQLSDFAGKVLVIDFIFTRCTYPEFCPALSRKFAALQKQLSSGPAPLTNVHLLSISFDPKFDQPAQLKGYGRTYSQNPALWTLATGSLDQIDRLTGHFELYFSRNADPAGQNHNLRTVVLDGNRKLVQLFKGKDWTLDDLEASVRKAAAQP
jgi:protein SCO1/2